MTPERADLLVLCALARAKPPAERELAREVQRLGLAGERVADVTSRLRARGLVAARRRVATEDGQRLVREAFGLSRVPSWKDAKRHAAALALGFVPGSMEARRLFEKSLAAAILAHHYGLAITHDVRALCEQLLFAKLALPAFAVRDARLLAHVLGQRAGLEPRGKLEPFAAQVAAVAIGARGTSKELLAEALARRWFGIEAAARPASFDDTVRAGLARVPASGRYGSEKVFIASLWDAVARDAPPEMDLAHFKRWLIDANAKQAVVLARADLVGAMDPAQVAASEIVDRGASFHFVLDHR